MRGLPILRALRVRCNIQVRLDPPVHAESFESSHVALLWCVGSLRVYKISTVLILLFTSCKN